MPLFEYKCKRCGKVFEALVSSAGGQAPVCEACGGRDMEKLFSTPAVHVKGAGRGAPACGKPARCCGRAEPCDAPPCAKD